MKYTNRLGLPPQIVRAVINDKYSKGNADFSVTELLKPAQLSRLLKQHAEQLSEDVSERIWSVLGQATHSILERAYEGEQGVIVERRFFHTFPMHPEGLDDPRAARGYTVSGQVDVIDADGALWDWKVTSVYTASLGRKEWEQQLNMLKLLATRSGIDIDIKALRIGAILRDWQQSKAGINAYPETQVVVLDIPMWEEADTEAFIHERLLAHTAEEVAPCTPEERWQATDGWAVMRRNRKTAVRVFDSGVEAADFLVGGSPDLYVVPRPGESRRCARYCPVSAVCPQWAAMTPF